MHPELLHRNENRLPLNHFQRADVGMFQFALVTLLADVV